MTPQATAAKTYFWDRFRGAGQGLTEACWQVFALLVAIRVFEADESIKQFIPAGLGIGLLLSPLGLSIANHLNLRISTIISILWVGVAFFLAAMTVAPGIILFVLFIALAQILGSQTIPLMTHLYSTNYRSSMRGGRLATTFLIASTAGIVFGYLGGELMDWKVGFYPVIFGVGIGAALLSAYSAYRIPSEKAWTLQSKNPLRSLKIAWKDKLFGTMLAAWMLMGLGNLMLIPIRVEYLANPAYGINASNSQISALLISTVLAFRLLSTKIWGYFFDRINVVVLRISLNMVSIASIMCFFFTDRLWLIAIGCALLGTVFGGGGILWNLYVTKIAPPEEISTYMSVHSFTTGLRMAMAPFIGYTVVEYSHPVVAAWIALLLIGISTIMFLPLKPLIDAKAASLDQPPPQRFNSTNPA